MLERLIADNVIAKQGSFPEDRYSLTVAGVLDRSGLSRQANALLDAVHRVLQVKFHDEPDAYSFSWTDLKTASGGSLSDADFMFARRFVEDAELSPGAPFVFDPNKKEMVWTMRSDKEVLIDESPRGMFDLIRRKKDEVERKRREELVRFNSGLHEANGFALPGTSPAEFVATQLGPVTAEQTQSRLRDEDVEKALESTAPYLAACYRQMIVDFEAPKRETFVGPAAELREVLVGVLHERAGDEELRAAGVSPEGPRGFTHRQRANFILKKAKKDASSALRVLATIEPVDGLARDIYQRASKGTHKGVQGAREIEYEQRELKTVIGYLNVLLRDLLL